MSTHLRHGPVVHGDGTTTFRVWAPRPSHVALLLEGGHQDMTPAGRGWHVTRTRAEPGDRYGFVLDAGEPLPDPASRHQPDGVHGLSAVVDPTGFEWPAREAGWRPAPLAGAAIYELHVGTFTAGGTFDAARTHLPGLAELGVTHVEVMPVNAFNGTHGWGYDGVAWYAVHEPYGGPDAFAGFVAACHEHGLAVVLDVVYNHLGPSGSYLPEFGPYLTERYGTPWGAAMNLDGHGADQVRDFIVSNVLMWLEDYRVDGLRLDAVHGLVDTSTVHILTELAASVDELEARVGRPKQLIAESDRQDPATIRAREAGGHGLAGQWVDDLHHGLHVAVTGESEGYYADYTGLPDVAACYERGFVYDGRYSAVRGRTVGAPLGALPSHRLVGCVQNHDQVGNRAMGDRLTTITDHDSLRVAVALLCAAPTTPMLFMGEEYGETRPFRYFSSHPEPELATAVSAGRRSEFAGFGDFTGEVPDPQDPATWRASVLDRAAAHTPQGRAWRALWSDLLALRRSQPALVSGRRELVSVLAVDSEVLALVRRHPAGPAVLVTANLSASDRERSLDVEPGWVAIWSSQDGRYGGNGRAAVAEPATKGLSVRLPSRSATLWAATPEVPGDVAG